MPESDESLESDRFPGTPHPRESLALHGHAAGERAFLEAWHSGRLHHAWLIGGAPGIGKATLAYRIARFVLAGGPDPGTLAIPAEHRVTKQVAALSHPSFTVLRRPPAGDRKTAPAAIPVDAVRQVSSLFAATAADGGYRVCIVDSADDLTTASANALLKLVEEPPSKSLFLIVSHAPQRLLPTLRSRCRRLGLGRLSPETVLLILRSLGQPWSALREDLLQQAIVHADGSVRRALDMVDEDRIALAREVEVLLDALPGIDLGRVATLAEAIARKSGEERLSLVLDTVLAWIAGRARAGAALGPARLAPLAEVWEKTTRAAREAEIFNLDRRPLVLSLFGDLAQALRHAS